MRHFFPNLVIYLSIIFYLLSIIFIIIFIRRSTYFK
nr:MAG TPA: hypothetical protein [Caudoviricetes sp.]